MKKLVTGLLFALLTMSSPISLGGSIPDDLAVREHWISLTKSYDIETNTHKLGTLYRRFFSFLLTYDFYDPRDIKTATATARFFSFGAHLDIYDQTDSFIGSVEEKIFTFFPTFEILGYDSYTKQARAEMNFWGTKFYIYDPATNQEMAIMSRPFFRLKNDWTIHVTNRALLDQKNIDARVLMTVLAVQGEIEDWKKNNDSDGYLKAKPNTAYTKLSREINTLNSNNHFKTDEKLSEKRIELLANELDQEFNAMHPASEEQSNEERVKEFTSYCLEQINSQNLSEDKKQALLTLLNLRLQGHK